MEACSPAGGVCVMVGWTRMGELTLVSEDILLGKTLKGSYFGGKSMPDQLKYQSWSCSDVYVAGAVPV